MEKRLSDAEFEVMKIIWSMEPPATTTFIIQEIEDSANKSWRPSTIKTIINRLLDKGFIEASNDKKDRKFSVLIPQDKYVSFETRRFVAKYHGNSLNSFFANLSGMDSKNSVEDDYD